MSYVLEGILVSLNESDGIAALADVSMEFDVVAVDENATILARPGRPQFDDAVCDLAAELSKQCGSTMVVRWDDRIGLRESRVYRDGELSKRFSVDDELYVKLDDDGMPLEEGQIFTESELDEHEDEEFEVYENALELGCEVAGFCSWTALHGFIQRQG